MATALVAKAPWVAPYTREPTENLGFAASDGVDRTMPANSAPETHGNAGEAVSLIKIGRGTLELTWLVLILALDLEDVEKVRGSSVDLDDIFVWFRPGIWKVRHLELVGSLRTGKQCSIRRNRTNAVVP